MKENSSQNQFCRNSVAYLDQAGGTHHTRLLAHRDTLGPLLQQCPHQCDTLQCLAQPHLVCHDTAVRAWYLYARDTSVHERHALRYMRGWRNMYVA